jgi:RND family efflux transporter MFP subunit
MGWLSALALIFGVFAAAHRAPAGGETGQPRPAPGQPRPGALARFLKLSPAERFRLIEKAGMRGVTTQKVSRGVLRLEIVERGTLEAARSSDLICTVKTRTRGSTVASTIRWVIDDGTVVKKGEKLIELDDSGLRDELQSQALELERAVADHAKAVDDLKLVRMDTETDIRLAEIAIRLVELRAKRANVDDPDQKEQSQLEVEQARLGLKRTKALARVKEAAAQAEVRMHASRVALQKARKNELEAELARCVLRAPQDGMVVYYVPEQVRGGGGTQQSIVAQGEPVREGQKMLQIPDLSRMQVKVRVHEALVSHLHDEGPGDRDRWQRAQIRVDAFPNGVLTGHVKTVDTVASQQDWFSSDVKLYKTVVAIDTPAEGLKPGMSAEVRIVAQQTPGPALQVPVQSVVAAGQKRFCLVVTDKEVQEREVVTGLSNDLAVEIRSGLKEGERVLLSPRGLARRLGPWMDNQGKRPSAQGQARRASAIVVRSVKPADAPRARSWIETYGLSHRDYERIAALPAVRQAVPVRSFPQEARHLARVSSAQVVATTPEYADVTGLSVAEGRFLTEEDGRHFRNVVVLGAAVADKLFPGEEPVGATLVLGKTGYAVVGVLSDQDEATGGLAAWEANRGIYLPLRTCQVRFGERVVIVRGGRRSAEAVALHAILVSVRAPGDMAGAAEDIREILEQGHTLKDWAVEAPSGV